MKAFGLLSIIIATLIVAVLAMKQLQPGSAMSPENIKRNEGAAQRASGQMNQSVVQMAVGAYQAQKEHWPGSLEELVQDGYLDHVPPGLIYDPASGRVDVAVTAPAAPVPASAAPAAQAPASASASDAPTGVTGQQNFSGLETAEKVIEALGR